jgi:hypothetical protein
MIPRSLLFFALAGVLLAKTCLLIAEETKIYLDASESEAISAKEGQAVIVYGVATGSGKSASGTNFVRFGESEFYLVTFKSDLDPFTEGEPYEIYEGKRLAIQGIISLYQNKPQIKLTSPEQVTILADDAVYPPVAVPPAKASTVTKSSEEPTSPSAETTTPVEKPKPPVDPSEYFRR